MFKDYLSNKKLNFFCVTLPKNIPVIKKNYINLKSFYKNFNYYIICPKKDVVKFQRELHMSNIQIINEDSFLTKRDFSKIFHKYFSKTNYLKKIKWREGWYYQQVLKISFVFFFFKNKNTKHLIQWEADTIILRKIEFFKNNKPIIYGTLFEKNNKYFVTLKELFRKLPKHYLSFTFQFSSLNYSIINNLFTKLNSYERFNFKNTPAKWISTIMLHSITTIHKNYNISFFSEQDLFGISQLLNKKKTYQKTFIYFRNFTRGELSNFEIRVLKKLKFYHITYDNYDLVKNKKSNQFFFFYYLLRLIIRYLYRHIKYLLSYLIKN